MKDNKNSDTQLKQLALEVKQARARAGLSQEALALAANVDRTYVSQLERGIANPSVQVLQRIASALGTDLIITLQSPSFSE